MKAEDLQDLRGTIDKLYETLDNLDFNDEDGLTAREAGQLYGITQALSDSAMSYSSWIEVFEGNVKRRKA